MSKKAPNLLHLLNSYGFLSLSRVVLKKIKLIPATFLSELVNKRQHYIQNNLIADDDWFYQSIEDVEENTSLSRKMQDRAIEVLTQLNLIETKRMGSGALRHFRINQEAILDLLDDSPSSTPPPEKPKNQKRKSDCPDGTIPSAPYGLSKTDNLKDQNGQSESAFSTIPSLYKTETRQESRQAEQTRGETPAPPLPACLPAASDENKNPADLSDEENIAILRNDLKWAFDESQMTRAIEFYKRMTWDEISKATNLTGKIRNAIENGWDLERRNKAYHPTKNSEAFRDTQAATKTKATGSSQFNDLDLSGSELNEALAIATKEIYGSRCLQSSGIEVMCGCIEFFWTMGSDEILFCLTNGEFWDKLSKRLTKWNFDPNVVRSVVFKDHLKMVKS